ncbi:helix-turn-helix domain-containing protein [Microbaculum marinum]|uniref:Helix-turn-helix domain-containing protein n=1 Tax=Microbaculum marinum TaxID=1764581 RepID=A0AAW9RTW2_9HYPH
MLTARDPRTQAAQLVADRLWCVCDAAADGQETILPSGRAQLIFSLSETPIELDCGDGTGREAGAHCVLQGPSTVPRRVSRWPQRSACGISFRPGGAGALFADLHKTADKVVPLSQFWDIDAATLTDRLRSLPTHDARLDLLEDEVARRCGDVADVRRVGLGLELMRSGAGVGEVAEQLGMPVHVFRRLFLRTAGLTPKRYLGIERFRAAIAGLDEFASLADLASAADYSDQAHMTREVLRFASVPPGRLRASERPYMGHVL